MTPEQIEKQLQQLERGGAEQPLLRLGELLRREGRLSADQRRRLDALRGQLRLGPDAAGRLDTDSLERGLRRLAPAAEAPLALLEQREALEGAVLAAERLGLRHDDLQRRLARIDRLGPQRIRAFLHLNAARRAAREQLDRPDGWWWSLRVGCDPLALATPGEPPEALLKHVQGCVHCQEDLGWLQAVDRTLGHPDDGHPSTADLVTHAAGEGAAAWRQEVAGHLRGCPDCQRLARAAAAGLAEAEQVERGLARLAAAAGPAAEEAAPLHLPLPLAIPSRPRALAADPALAEEPGLPDQRHVLLEVPRCRVVLLGSGGRARLALFADRPAALQVTVTLDGKPLPEGPPEPEARIFELGPLRQLAGRTLGLQLGSARRSWTLVGEAP